MRQVVIAAVSLCLLLGVAACNLVVSTSVDVTPAAAGDAQVGPITFVTATPFGNPVAPTPAGSVSVTPNAVAPPPGANFADWMVNNVIVPAWNFLYSFAIDALTSTWNFAGARGGIIAQGLCCIGPVLLFVVAMIRYVTFRRGAR